MREKNFGSAYCFLMIIIAFAFLMCACSNGGTGTEGTTHSTNPAVTTEQKKESGTGQTSAAATSASSTGKIDEKLDIDRARTTLEEFLTAGSLHMKCLVTYTTYIASPVDPKTFEFWIKGLNYRSDEYEGSGIKFITIVKDKDAKQYSMKSKSILVPLMPPENYTDSFKWDISGMDQGTVIKDGGYAVFVIDGIDRFYRKEGAQAGYYYTKVEFGVKNDTVIYTTLYGNSSYGEKPKGVNTVTQTYEFVNIDEDFGESIFDAPF